MHSDDQNSMSKMQLQSAKVTGLFGRFNHKIEFRDSEKILILTAPNGYGKTAILKMIDAFFGKKLFLLHRQSFSSFQLQFSNGDRVVVAKTKPAELPLGDNKRLNLGDDRKPPVNVSMTIEGWISGNYENWDFQDLSSTNLLSGRLDMIEDIIPQLDRVGPDYWIDMSTGRRLDLREVLDLYGERIPNEVFPVKIPDWLASIISHIDCRLIETQRVMQIEASRTRRYRGDAEQFQFAVEKHAKDLSRRIKEKLSESAATSQKLDQTFPHRVLQKVSEAPQQALTDQESLEGEKLLRESINSLERRRTELMDAGLLASSMQSIPGLPQTAITDQIKIVLDLYVEDTRNKLALFDDLYNRISVFKNILNEKYHFKSIEIDQEVGIRVRTEEGETVPISSLSSGEQHELILIYELLFFAQKNALILIDEPEISLHIAWQKRFLDDLKDIIELNKFQAIVATHSPQIINDRWDLTHELQAPSSQ